ncbi:glycosyltransferase family 2 protein [Saccharospirillum salsuginis]|uniref:Glycosyl transferase n=1 Tax=Saccharospirillum salsuginis TaxID=418750 RepID=A0A918NDQ0_9GAMM|nr:glycosyltransferase family 2 protein [Saccharospirillum salsuginis]GGX60386.1 glycosyl transferase [Saccharospirillum salsuginis]
MKPKEYIQYIKRATQLKRLDHNALNHRQRPEVPVVVSLTSIPSRLKQIHLTLRSLMAQSVRPISIVLWLNEDLKDQLPQSLTSLTGDLLEIRYSPLTCSHRKLIHSLEAFPNQCIVTSDDDVMYPSNWLDRLWREHEDHPDDIIANRCNLITYDSDGNTLPYRDWIKQVPPGTCSLALMPAGYGGVLYPPHSLRPEATNADLFLKLTPKADDLWFKAMSYLNGTLCRRAGQPGEKPVPVHGTQSVTLAKSNIREDHNRLQWDALRNYFQFTTPQPDQPEPQRAHA